MKILYCLVIMLVSGLCHGQVYRCLNEHSEITFIDTPCDPQSQPYEIKQTMALKLKDIDAPSIVRIKAKSSAKKSSPSANCPRFSATQLRNLRVKDQFEKGMPATAIMKRFGKAQQIQNKPNNKQTWVYKSSRVRRTFKFKDDCLLSWQEKWKGKKSKLSKYQQ